MQNMIKIDIKKKNFISFFSIFNNELYMQLSMNLTTLTLLVLILLAISPRAIPLERRWLKISINMLQGSD